MRSLIFATLLLGAADVLGAQIGQSQTGRILQTGRRPASSDTSHTSDTSLLRRRVTLDLQRATLVDAIDSVDRQARLGLTYSQRIIPERHFVTLTVRDVTVAEAFDRLLRGTGIDVEVTRGGQIVLVSRKPAAPVMGTLRGRVTEAATDQPVSGVVVTVDETRQTTTTGPDGSYRIAGVPAGEYGVTARRLGYSPLRRSITIIDGAEAVLDFALTAAPSRLSTVITTVTGDQRRLEVGNAIAAIDADSLTQLAPITSMSTLLTGRAAGVQVLSATGLTGVGSRIRIRGMNSMSLTNDPIVYVDGVRVESRDVTTVGSFMGGFASSRLDDLNPEEIESIDIIRGPAAATLYGTDAANGVVLITTKRGKAGRAEWHVYGEGGTLSQLTDRIPTNYYGWGRTRAGAVAQCLLPTAATGGCTMDSLGTYSPLGQKETTPFGAGGRAQYGAQVSGGSTAIRYFLSGEYERERGALRMPDEEVVRLEEERGASIPEEQRIPNTLRRVSVRGNFDAQLSETFRVSVSTGYLNNFLRLPHANGGGNSGLMPNIYGGVGYRDVLDGYKVFRAGDIFSLESYQDIDRFTAGIESRWDVTPWLDARARMGLDHTTRTNDFLQRRDQGIAQGNQRQGLRRRYAAHILVHTADLGATARYALGSAFKGRTAVGAQYYSSGFTQLGITAEVLTPGGQTVGAGATRNGSEGYTNSVTIGAYLEQTVSLHDRLFLTAGLRTDDNSGFGQDFDAAYYPRGSLSWVVSDEDFFPTVRGLSSLRLRAAYGVSGVQPAPRTAVQYYSATVGAENGRDVTGLALGSLGNVALRPERSTELETGVDLDWFGDRASLEITYYDRKSRDALVRRPLPLSYGVGMNRLENIGAVRNSGLELTLDARPVDRKAFAWDLTVTASNNRNRLLVLGEGVTPSANPGSRILHTPGYPLFGRWERPILGYADRNGDGLLDETEVQVGDTAVFLGRSTPGREFALSTAITFLDGLVRLGAQADYRGDFLLYNNTEFDRCTGIGNCRAINDPTAPLDEQARAVAARSAALGRTPAGYMEPADYLRLREMSLTLTAPVALARRLGTRRASLTVSGRNLALFTRYSGADPEASWSIADDISPTDINIVPQVRYWIARVNLGF